MIKPYPDRNPALIGRVVTDLLAVAWTALWIYLGFSVHSLLLTLRPAADALIETGQTFQSWIDQFRNAAPTNIPFIGNAISDYFHQLADSVQGNTSDRLIAAGHQLADVINTVATVAGLITAAVPIAIVTTAYVVWRIRDMREMGAAVAFVEAARLGGRVPEAKAVLAFRAVSTLPFRRLMKVSADPVSDLQAQRHDALADEMMRNAGLDSARLTGPAPQPQLPPATGG